MHAAPLSSNILLKYDFVVNWKLSISSTQDIVVSQ